MMGMSLLRSRTETVFAIATSLSSEPTTACRCRSGETAKVDETGGETLARKEAFGRRCLLLHMGCIERLIGADAHRTGLTCRQPDPKLPTIHAKGQPLAAALVVLGGLVSITGIDTDPCRRL